MGISNADIKRTCNDVLADMNAISDSISETHQNKFLELAGNAINQIDYRLKYPGNLTDADISNLKIARTGLAYLRNLIVVYFAGLNQTIGVVRPDLSDAVDRVVKDIQITFDFSENSTFSISGIAFIEASAEHAVNVYYNPPRKSFFHRLMSRWGREMMNLIRGTKG